MVHMRYTSQGYKGAVVLAKIKKMVVHEVYKSRLKASVALAKVVETTIEQQINVTMTCYEQRTTKVEWLAISNSSQVHIEKCGKNVVIPTLLCC